MKEVFADTVYWIVLLNPRDALHERARQAPCPPRLTTTLAVQLEVMDAFRLPAFRPLASLFWQITTTNPDVLVADLPSDRMHTAVQLFGTRPDKFWSLTDCFSFVVMQERQITEALTSDHHFEQAGFVALLK